MVLARTHFSVSGAQPLAGGDLLSPDPAVSSLSWTAVIFSQDGHLPLVLNVLRNKAFWHGELGCAPPEVVGMGWKKLVWLRKPVD